MKTAEKIHSFILIGSDDKINVKPSDGYSASTETLDLTNHSLNNFIQKYNHIKPYNSFFQKLE